MKHFIILVGARVLTCNRAPDATAAAQAADARDQSAPILMRMSALAEHHPQRIASHTAPRFWHFDRCGAFAGEESLSTG